MSPAGDCSHTSWAEVLTAAGCASNGTDCYVLSRVTAPDGSVVAENPQLLEVPGRLAFPSASVVAVVSDAPNPDGSVNVQLQSSATALFVTLTTAAQGRFDPNVIMMPGVSNTTIRFIPFVATPLDLELLRESLRIDHVAAYSVRG